MNLHVLVTGAAGHIGSVLVPRLLQREYQVTVLDNFMYGQTSLMGCCSNERFCVARGDSRDEHALRKAMAKADVIIPLAAVVGAPACDADPLAATSTNLDAIKLLLKLRSSDQRIVSPCTNSGYGVGQQDNFCTEETPMLPISLYGRNKVEAERAILEAGNAISLRLATVFGMSPRMRLDLLVNDFVHRAFADGFIVIFEGHFKRNYVHIKDVVDAFCFAIDNYDQLKNEPYNVGLSEANLSKLELCEKIKEQIQRFVYIEAEVGEDPDKRDYVVSNEKIERAGFRARHTLESGIQELVEGYAMLPRPAFSNV